MPGIIDQRKVSGMNLGGMRSEYRRGELRREDLKADPVAQFTLWFEEACSAGVLEPNAMSLATASAGARPSVRTVLLKSFDARGFVFFTNLESRKGREIAENPQVALLFPWLAVDPLDGSVNVAWYDTRADSVSNRNTQMFYSRSSNGGASFEPAS